MSEMEPRYFVDHGTIHDRITGQHVDIDEAAGMLSVEPEAMQRVAWGVVIKLGVALKNAEHDRDRLARRVGELEALEQQRQDRALLHGHLVDKTNRLVDEVQDLRAQLATVRAERDEAERRARNAEGVYTRDMAEMFKAREEADTLRAKLQVAEERAAAQESKESKWWCHVESDTAERIAAWLDTWIGKLPLVRLSELAADIRTGAWRQKEGS